MEKILSQEEIDALLNGIEEGKVDTSPEPRTAGGAETAPYDFSNQDRNIRGRMPTLEVLNDFFARSLRNTLTVVLRKSLEVVPQELAMMKYGEFTKTLPLPSSIHVFKMTPLRGNGLLVLDPKLVFSFVDIFLGGTGRMNFRIEGRDFTAIESKLIMKVVNMIFTDLERNSSRLLPVRAQRIQPSVCRHRSPRGPGSHRSLRAGDGTNHRPDHPVYPLFFAGTHQSQALLRVSNRPAGVRSQLGPETGRSATDDGSRNGD
jgi:flagellar motor switch protein FliM